MKRIATHVADTRHNQERWLLTYADMITLLTAFFLMLYSMSVVSRGKFSAVATSVRSGFSGATPGSSAILAGAASATTQSGAPSESAAQRYAQAVQKFTQFVEQHNLSGNVQTRQDERGLVISLLADAMLFERGRSDLRPASRSLLDQVADIVRAAPNQVQIEGHTCNLPIRTAQFPSNWELSTARAATVLRFFTENNGLPDRRFTASGYAQTRPLVPNTSEANRARNRRVDIVLLKTDAERAADRAREAETRRILVPSESAGEVAATAAPTAASAAPSPAEPAAEAAGAVTEP